MGDVIVGSRIRRAFGNAFLVCGIVLLLGGILLGSMFSWPDAWVEWLARYWTLLGRERAGLSVFMYCTVAVIFGLALASAGVTLRAVQGRENSEPGEEPTR